MILQITWNQMAFKNFPSCTYGKEISAPQQMDIHKSWAGVVWLSYD